MTAGPVTLARRAHGRQPPRLAWLASIVLFGALPVFGLAVMFYDAVATEGVAFDFRVFYLAAEARLEGEPLYPAADDPIVVAGRAYVYPPLTAIVLMPLTALPMELAGLVVMVVLVATALAIPWVLGVRDWRCYGLVVLWPPVISAIQTGTVSLVLALFAALVWRYRERDVRAGIVLGAALAVKLVLWPLGLWLAALGRKRALAWSVLAAVAFVFVPWAAIGFDGLREYPALLDRLSDVMDERGYTFYSLALEYGVPSQAARALWALVALALLAAVALTARRGDVKVAFVLAIAASLACSPIVWLHYFSLLLVVAAIAQPRLGVVWFVPFALFLTPGSGDPTPFQTTATVAAVVLTVAFALRELRRERTVGARTRTAAVPASR